MKRQGQGGGELNQGGGQPRAPPLPSGTEQWPLQLPQLRDSFPGPSQGSLNLPPLVAEVGTMLVPPTASTGLQDPALALK